MTESNDIAPTIVIFGASGDLTERKLIPALYELHRKGRILDGTRVVGFSRTAYTHDAFRTHLQEGVREFTPDYDEATWARFASNIYYASGQPDAQEDFEKLKALLEEIEGGQPAGRLYYMATPPALFKSIVQNLGRCEMHREIGAWRRLIIEKPFGHDLASAFDLNICLHSVFRERQIYRIDHYLGKETVQNVTVFRFANAIFEPIWNRNYIDNVQISVLENVSVGRRGGYYEKAGVFRDMFQNHLLQLLTLIAMEPPAALNADALRNEKVKVLSAIKPLKPDRLAGCVVHAQYRSYRDAEGVDRKSRTPTFAALKLYVDNWRWQGVPFYLRSGKSLAEKRTRIAVQFKSPPHLLFDQNHPDEFSPNILAMEIQPQEGIHLSFQAKVPAVGIKMQEVNFDFQYAQAFKGGPIPEAYERLLLDALQGDASLFTRSDEIELSWGLIDPILEGLKLPGAPPLEFYEEDSFGPEEASDLLARDGFKWVM
jgi:glucose-6-phosphate 1-dehydrogenase